MTVFCWLGQGQPVAVSDPDVIRASLEGPPVAVDALRAISTLIHSLLLYRMLQMLSNEMHHLGRMIELAAAGKKAGS